MFVRVNGKKVTGIANNPEALGDKNVFEVDDLPGFTELDELMWDGKRVVLDPDYTPPEAEPPIEEKLRVLAKKVSGESLASKEAEILERMKKQEVKK